MKRQVVRIDKLNVLEISDDWGDRDKKTERDRKTESKTETFIKDTGRKRELVRKRQKGNRTEIKKVKEYKVLNKKVITLVRMNIRRVKRDLGRKMYLEIKGE